jgi:hypothetical protein
VREEVYVQVERTRPFDTRISGCRVASVIIPDGVDVVFPDTAAAIDAQRAVLVGHRDGGGQTVLVIADVETGMRA